MNKNIRKSAHTGELYEIQYLVHPRPHPLTSSDVYACYRLSGYDGMPIGGLVWIAEHDFVPVQPATTKGE